MVKIHSLHTDWPLPAGVNAFVSCKSPTSSGYGDCNIALHVGDVPFSVHRNRDALASALGVKQWQWLEQVHGAEIALVDTTTTAPIRADAVSTRERSLVCAVMTADCLPILLAAEDGSQVAAVHAGWRGLAAGVIRNSVHAFAGAPLCAYLGPAIGPESFEVGSEVRAAFEMKFGLKAMSAFTSSSVNPHHFYADLYALAKIELEQLGVKSIFGGGWDTYTDTRFYSYRREPVTGRMVSAIWLA